MEVIFSFFPIGFFQEYPLCWYSLNWSAITMGAPMSTIKKIVKIAFATNNFFTACLL
jgi:hypothetical protein